MMDKTSSQTPMSYAAEMGNEAIMRLLLANRAYIEKRDSYGRKPLSLATGNRQKAVVQLLLENGTKA
jgi:ankyrin repeat protein